MLWFVFDVNMLCTRISKNKNELYVFVCVFFVKSDKKMLPMSVLDFNKKYYFQVVCFKFWATIFCES